MSELTFRGTELYSPSTGLMFVVRSGLDDEAEVRGEDVVIPGKAGRLVTNRVEDRRLIVLSGTVYGQGVTEDAARLAYRNLISTLHGIFGPTSSPGALVAYGPRYAASGHNYSINARYLSAVWGDWIAGLSRHVDVTLESVDSPPDWTYT